MNRPLRIACGNAGLPSACRAQPRAGSAQAQRGAVIANGPHQLRPRRAEKP